MQAIRTRYFGPTDTKGSRISAKNRSRTIYISYDHALDVIDNHRAAARELKRLMQWGGDMVGGIFYGDWYWVFDDDISTGE